MHDALESVPAITQRIVIIGGFLQGRYSSGMATIYRALHAQHASPHCAVTLHEWNEDWPAFVRHLLDTGPFPRSRLNITILAYSSGMGHGCNVGEWGRRGYGIPNPGRNADTVNEDIEEFVREGGKRISVIMHCPMTALSDPPPWNEVKQIIQFMNRTRQVLLGRAVDENEIEFRGKHVESPRQPLRVFPCPTFNVQNALFRTFVKYAFAILSELMQSPETVKYHDVTTGLANRCVSYVARLQKRLAMEYFGMSEEESGNPSLDLLTQQTRYKPRSHGMVDAESFDLIGASQLSLPQPQDLGPLAQGILVQDLTANIGPYPFGGEVLMGTGTQVTAETNLPDLPENL